MLHVLLSGAILLGNLEVTIKSLNDQTVSGQLVELDSEQLKYKTKNIETTLDTQKLLSISPKSAKSLQIQPSALQVKLVDGSFLQAIQYEARRGKSVVRLTEDQQIKIRTRLIHWVILTELSSNTSKKWKSLVQENSVGDLLVVRRQSRQINSQASPEHNNYLLDPIEGVLHDVTPDSVSFEYDDSNINVDRQKVAGIIYYRPDGTREGVPICRIRDVTGNIWNVKSLQLEKGQIKFVSIAGLRYTLPLAKVNHLDFSAGKILYLSELEPSEFTWLPFLGGKIDSSRLFAYQRNRNFSGNPLSIDDVKFEKGLIIHSRSKLTYRLPRNFTRFTAIAGIDNSIRTHGHVLLTVFGDNDKLLEESITTETNPLKINLNISGYRRLKIFVDYGDKSDIGDHLVLGNARIFK